MRELKKQKKEISGGSTITGMGGVRRLLKRAAPNCATFTVTGWLRAIGSIQPGSKKQSAT
jgi:hypothetical protein